MIDTTTLLLATLGAALALGALQAWRLGNERRDVALIGSIGGLCGAGAALAAWL